MDGVIDHRKALGFFFGILTLLTLGSMLTEKFLVRVECVSQKLFGGHRDQVCGRVLTELVTVQRRNGANRPVVLPLNSLNAVRHLENQAWEQMLDAAASGNVVAAEDEKPKAPRSYGKPQAILDYGRAPTHDQLRPARAGFSLPYFDDDDEKPDDAPSDDGAPEAEAPEFP